MLRKTALISNVSLLAFANPAVKPSANTTKTPDAPPAVVPGIEPAPAAAPVQSAAKRRERANVTVTAISAPMALPVGVAPSRRGGKSKYRFDDLIAPVPNPDKPGEFLYASFGLTGMDKKGFSSTLFTQNAKFKKQEPKRDEAGNIIMKPGPEIRDQAGVLVGHGPGTEPETIEVITKEFIAIDVDPAKDQEGASLRVFRTK